MKELGTTDGDVIVCAYSPSCYPTFISFVLFDLSNGSFSKKSIFTCWSVLTDFCHQLHLPLILIPFQILFGILESICYSSFYFNGFQLKFEPKGLLFLHTLMLPMRLV